MVILNIYLASGYDDVISEPIMALAGFNFALFYQLISFVVLEIQKYHAWKMGGAPRDSLCGFGFIFSTSEICGAPIDSFRGEFFYVALGLLFA